MLLPKCSPLVSGALQEFCHAVLRTNGPLTLITGAGLSTESGIPCYRGDTGTYSRGHKPITHQEFMSGHPTRCRYWARATLGYPSMLSARPNRSHQIISELLRSGAAHHLITQNVDGLHQKAGADSSSVTELHGSVHEVDFLGCGGFSTREAYHALLLAANPAFHTAYQRRVELARLTGTSAPLAISTESHNSRIEDVSGGSRRLQDDAIRPDGDVDVDHTGFTLPECPCCGRDALQCIPMPRLVFFGGTLRPEVRARAAAAAVQGTAVLILGSSMSTRSAYDLALAAKAARIPVFAVTVGPTRTDNLLTKKLDAYTTDVLAALADELLAHADAV